MRYLIRLSMAFTIIALLGACATAPGREFTGIAPTVMDKGDVYLYRTDAIYAIGQSFSVFVDGQKAGELFNESYVWLRLHPGRHSLKVAPGGIAATSETTLQVQAGEVSFYQYDFVTGPLANPLFIGSSIKLRNRDEALGELKNLKAAKDDKFEQPLPTEAGGAISVENVDAVPMLNERGKEAYREWLKKSPPRAFVIAENYSWNATWGKRKDTTDPVDPAERAMKHCQQRGLKKCKLYAVDNRVYWTQE